MPKKERKLIIHGCEYLSSHFVKDKVCKVHV